MATPSHTAMSPSRHEVPRAANESVSVSVSSSTPSAKSSGMPSMSDQLMVGAGPTHSPSSFTTGVPSTAIWEASTGPPDTSSATVAMVA